MTELQFARGLAYGFALVVAILCIFRYVRYRREREKERDRGQIRRSVGELLRDNTERRP
jgi:flagellar biosynthesis/type III secretory pathway M-ring protein FliF/YscJ